MFSKIKKTDKNGYYYLEKGCGRIKIHK